MTLLTLTSFSPKVKKSKSIEDTNPQVIQLRKYHHMYFIEIKMNGKKGNLLVDTGAAFTIFDINQASQYGFRYFKTNNDLKLVGLNGQSERYSLMNYKVHHDEKQLLVHAYGADLKSLTESFYEKGIDILGIIGSDYFTTSKAIIDYKNNQLIIHN